MRATSLLTTALLTPMFIAGCMGAPDPLESTTVTAGAVSELQWIDNGTSATQLPADVAALLATGADADETLKGACCLGDACVWTTSQVCSQAQGTFLGAGRPCDSDSCIVATLALIDSDGDGCSDLNELYAHTNPQVPGDCQDIDADGIPNKDDPDVDGDGIPNQLDPDIDGDGLVNDDDPDPDGDGEVAENDADEDGDGLSDRFDLDDDGDGISDDEDTDKKAKQKDDQQAEEDNSDDDGEDRLLNLLERLRDGELTQLDRHSIAVEVTKRLKGNKTQQDTFEAVLDEMLEQAEVPARKESNSLIPSKIVAVDALYEQLQKSIDAVRDPQKKRTEPLEDGQMKVAMGDFLARASALSDLGKTFQHTDHKTLSLQVTLLRNRFSTDAMKQARTLLIDAYEKDKDPKTAVTEDAWIESVPWGTTVMAKVFEHETIGDLVDNTHALFKHAFNKHPDNKSRNKEFLDLIDRVQKTGEKKYKDAVDRVIEEDNAEGGSQGDSSGSSENGG